MITLSADVMEYSSSKPVRLWSQSLLCTRSAPMHLNQQIGRNLDGSNASLQWRGWVKRTKRVWRKCLRLCLRQHFIQTASPLRRYASFQVLIIWGFARKGRSRAGYSSDPRLIEAGHTGRRVMTGPMSLGRVEGIITRQRWCQRSLTSPFSSNSSQSGQPSGIIEP